MQVNAHHLLEMIYFFSFFYSIIKEKEKKILLEIKNFKLTRN